jgi:hypothetical protein
MLWLIQNILFSISLIVVIHYLYVYFETTLTAPKVKDLIHCPKQKYKSLFDTINKNLDNHVSPSDKIERRDTSQSLGTGNGFNGMGTETEADSEIGLVPKNGYSEKSTKPNKEITDMKTDLKAFLRGIGLKSKSNNESSFRPSYEMS